LVSALRAVMATGLAGGGGGSGTGCSVFDQHAGRAEAGLARAHVEVALRHRRASSNDAAAAFKVENLPMMTPSVVTAVKPVTVSAMVPSGVRPSLTAY
jgi:hypothetical protein